MRFVVLLCAVHHPYLFAYNIYLLCTALFFFFCITSHQKCSCCVISRDNLLRQEICWSIWSSSEPDTITVGLHCITAQFSHLPFFFCYTATCACYRKYAVCSPGDYLSARVCQHHHHGSIQACISPNHFLYARCYLISLTSPLHTHRKQWLLIWVNMWGSVRFISAFLATWLSTHSGSYVHEQVIAEHKKKVIIN